MGGVILTKTHRSPHSVKRMNFRREKNPAAHNAAYNAAHNAAHNAAELSQLSHRNKNQPKPAQHKPNQINQNQPRPTKTNQNQPNQT